jgi:hypothetical protein
MPRRKIRKPPKIGLIFKAEYKRREYSMKVVGKLGSPKYKVGDKLFNTPTGAAKHITKTDKNGWKFWNMD